MFNDHLLDSKTVEREVVLVGGKKQLTHIENLCTSCYGTFSRFSQLWCI